MAVTEDVMGRAGRRGVTLVEVLVAVGIAAVLAGLLLGAVQRVRAEAVRVKSLNRLRQIALAVQGYSADRRGRLPTYTFQDLREYVGAGSPPAALAVPTFESPADPTLRSPSARGNTSYASNAQAFHPDDGRRPMSLADCPDGLSGTVAYGECYAKCRITRHDWEMGGPVMTCEDSGRRRVPCVNPGLRGPTFANADFDDVMPVTVGGVTLPSVAGVTFQVRPTAEQCDYRQLQTPHPGGMLTAYLDGSVRTTSPTVTPAVFWAAVTPAGGEVTPPE